MVIKINHIEKLNEKSNVSDNKESILHTSHGYCIDEMYELNKK